jgi:hypothetical protein
MFVDMTDVAGTCNMVVQNMVQRALQAVISADDVTGSEESYDPSLCSTWSHDPEYLIYPDSEKSPDNEQDLAGFENENGE